MRHAFASRMINRGLSSTVLARLMGHESSAITERRYIHLFDRQAHRRRRPGGDGSNFPLTASTASSPSPSQAGIASSPGHVRELLICHPSHAFAGRVASIAMRSRFSQRALKKGVGDCALLLPGFGIGMVFDLWSAGLYAGLARRAVPIGWRLTRTAVQTACKPDFRAPK